MKNCVSCSKEIETTKKFCGYCGAPQPAVSNPETPRKEPKAPKPKRSLKLPKVSGKVLALVGGSVIAIGAAATALALILTPPTITAKDVTAKFKVMSTDTLWDGDKVKTSASIALKSNFSGDYLVSLEEYDVKDKSWVALNEQTGEGPKFSLNKEISLGSGTNKYRLSIYRPGEPIALYTSKTYKVQTSAAYLPTECPYKEFIALVGPDANMTMDPGQIEGDTIYCTMYPTLPGDYFLDLTYTKVTKEAWDLLKKERFGTDVSLGIGETYAYTYTYSDELSGSYDKTIVNFRGIMIDSDWGTEAIKLAMEAIEVK
jgi:hypothetical protein